MIVEQYLHTLIPNDPQFAPSSKQLVHFLDGLSALGAAPLNPKLILLKPSGRMRSFTDPRTGEVKSFPANDRVPLNNTADLASTIEALQQYWVAIEGQGPPRLPPFSVYARGFLFTGNYGYAVRCCLRPQSVSMSDPGDEQIENGAVVFGSPCGTGKGVAVFCHPSTNEVIEVANASCARFWVELEFGKWLLPSIGNSLNILDPAITDLAAVSFGLPFAQGFHHY